AKSIFHHCLQEAGFDSGGGVESRSPFDAPLSCRDRAEIREACRGDALRGLLVRDRKSKFENRNWLRFSNVDFRISIFGLLAFRVSAARDWSRLRNSLPLFSL